MYVFFNVFVVQFLEIASDLEKDEPPDTLRLEFVARGGTFLICFVLSSTVSVNPWLVGSEENIYLFSSQDMF